MQGWVETMTKQDMLKALGGSTATAAMWLGIEPKTIYKWAVDGKGNLTSQRVKNDVLAAIVRKRVKDMVAAGDRIDPIERRLVL